MPRGLKEAGMADAQPTTAVAAPSTADWNALQRAIAGDVVLPRSPEYELLRKPAMVGFWHLRPQAIVRCRAPGDVAETLALARRSRAALAIRSGGHCFAGRSSTDGVLIDVGALNSVAVAEGTVTVGAGATLGDLYDALDADGRTIAGGCGPTVGIAGLTLGGGLGILGRRYGLTSDQLIGAEVVLADGRVVDCDADDHADLFWALRGAGGCRFGVVTRLTLATVPAPQATSFELCWPSSAAAAILAAWQQWAPDAPEEVAASLLVTAPAEPDQAVAVRLFGAVLGPEADARRRLDAFAARVGTEATATAMRELPYRETKRHLAEDDAGSALKPEPAHVLAKSEFFRRPLPADSIAALVEHLAADRLAGCARELDFSPWGGAYNRIASDATAFVHRAERFLLKHEVAVAPQRAQQAMPAAREWLARSWTLAHPSGTGGAYANFPDPDLSPWDPAYHGANRDRLLQIKASYDPDGLFGANERP
jgi:FAD/FMN-containing dehydrogenase